MNKAQQQTEFIAFLKEYLHHNPDALIWILSYVAYCHAIDDIIDGDKNDHTFILNTFRLAISIFSFPFYTNNMSSLRALIETAQDAYRDSVEMEKKNDALWKSRVGDIIRQNANDVILMTIMLTSGIEKRNEAALKLRELSFRTHHNELGERH